jgi:hypothetical protein
VNGIAAVQARMAAVQARFSTAEGQLVDGARSTGATEPSGDFATVLAAALAGTAGAAIGDDAAGGLALGAGAGGQLGGSGALGGLGSLGVLGSLARAGGRAGGSGGTAGGPAAIGAVAGGPGGAATPVASGGGGIVAAERKSPGQYGKLQPPAELLRYGNGRVPAEALSPIGIGSHRLWAPAARAFQAMRADAAAAGVEIGITDSYRDYDTQVSLARRKGLYSQGGLAATPGTSNHGWGMAVDLDLDSKAQAWMRENGWRYGFVEDTPREPWHWGFRPAGGTASVA